MSLPNDIRDSTYVPGGLCLNVCKVLELELHGGDVVPGVGLHEVLDVLVQVAGGDLGVAGEDGLEHNQ